MDTFEFSQNYTLFWDKLEKANYFLDSIIETAAEKLDSRLIQHLLQSPLEDGGQWDMFAAILKKYGSAPKSAMPETYHSSNTRVLETVLTSKLREFAKDIRNAHKNSAGKEKLETQKEDMLYQVYTILVKALGRAPEKFTYEYRDKDSNFHRIKDITPTAFFEEYVGWNLDDAVSLINAPTADKPYGRKYTVKYLGTVKEAKPVEYINTPNETLKESAIQSIKAGEPVWFDCDVGKASVQKTGIMDTDLYNYELTLNGKVHLTKAERLEYGDSLLTHAMVLVGVDLGDDGRPLNWKVENSWGEKVGDKGIFSISDDWFDEFTYQIAVNKKYVDEKWLKALDQPAIELEPWDPMGALAKVK